MENLKEEMLTQNNRSTSWPVFVVVEDRKTYGVDSEFSCDGRERKDADNIDAHTEICDTCNATWDKTGFLPEECDETECYGSFINYRIEKDVPNMRAAFFFTSKACGNHAR